MKRHFVSCKPGGNPPTERDLVYRRANAVSDVSAAILILVLLLLGESEPRALLVIAAPPFVVWAVASTVAVRTAPKGR